MNNKPIIAKKGPYKVTVEKGKMYAWCSCGYSTKQPFCDGKHRDNIEGYRSVKYCASDNGEVYFCGCKQSKNGILCDGSHNAL